ncbi:MAG: 50S ribosomal protein L21, partial [Phycisphaerales bacterium]|nr:50S ribosomal protein L21 [Phycisphaerales bacterium]
VGGDATLGEPFIKGATVTFEITDPKVMGDKIFIYKFRPKNTYQRKTGHRLRFTACKVTAIKG